MYILRRTCTDVHTYMYYIWLYYAYEINFLDLKLIQKYVDSSLYSKLLNAFDA